MAAECRTSVFVSSEHLDVAELLSSLGDPLRSFAVAVKDRRATVPPRLLESIVRLGPQERSLVGTGDPLAVAVSRLAAASAVDIPSQAELIIEVACEYVDHWSINLTADLLSRLGGLNASLGLSLTRITAAADLAQPEREERTSIGVAQRDWSRVREPGSRDSVREAVTATLAGTAFVFPGSWSAAETSLDDQILASLSTTSRSQGPRRHFAFVITGGSGEPDGYLSSNALRTLGGVARLAQVMVYPSLVLPFGDRAN